MGLNRWWNDASDKANDFLNTGSYNDVVRNAPLNNDLVGNASPVQTGGCTSSSQCPAGYACVNGVCTYMSTGPSGGSSNGQWNNAGGCDQEDPNSPCNSGGPNSCSQTPNCGDTPNPRPEDCCGDRCCSFGSASSDNPGVNCYCGKCPGFEGKKCSIFCDGYLSANGESAMGCSSENSCNECLDCDLFSSQCESKVFGGAPCWCEDAQCGGCFKCDTSASSSSFGECVPAGPGACSVCSHIESYTCPCGETVGPITACSKYGPGGSGYGGNVTLTGKTALQIAQEQCAPESSCDPCRGECTTKTYCSDTTGPPPACPPGVNCTETGTLSAGGVDCTFRTECDMSNVPESCKDCDCNCHNDCPECQLCGADGECYDDPLCANRRGTVTIKYQQYFTNEDRYLCFGEQDELPDTFGTGAVVTRTLTSDGEVVLIQATDQGTNRTYAGAGCDCPGVANGVQKNQIIITYRNYTVGEPDVGEQQRFEQGSPDGLVVCGPQWGNDYRENYNFYILLEVTVDGEVLYEREQPDPASFIGSYGESGPPDLE